MIQEDYVSFEVAKLLKEKGFDEPVLYYFRYGKCEPTYPVEGILSKNSDLFDAYSIPTLQMVMKWLREVHKIAINIGWGEVFEENYQWWCIILNQNSGEILRESEYCKTYEEAAEAAIKYCLENLI